VTGKFHRRICPVADSGAEAHLVFIQDGVSWFPLVNLLDAVAFKAWTWRRGLTGKRNWEESQKHQCAFHCTIIAR